MSHSLHNYLVERYNAVNDEVGTLNEELTKVKAEIAKLPRKPASELPADYNPYWDGVYDSIVREYQVEYLRLSNAEDALTERRDTLHGVRNGLRGEIDDEAFTQSRHNI